MWHRNKAKSLLKWLLLNPGKPYSADQLIDLFWNDMPVETALGNLHVTIHTLRHLLEPSLAPRQESTFLRHSSMGFYWFDMGESWWTDISEIHSSYAKARELEKMGEVKKALFLYRRIADCCCSELMPSHIKEEWLQPYRHYYGDICQQILIKLIRLYQEYNEPDEVLEYAYRALLLDPDCEPALKAIQNNS